MASKSYLRNLSQVLCSFVEFWWILFSLSTSLLVVLVFIYPAIESGSDTSVVAELNMAVLLVIAISTGLFLLGCKWQRTS